MNVQKIKVKIFTANNQITIEGVINEKYFKENFKDYILLVRI